MVTYYFLFATKKNDLVAVPALSKAARRLAISNSYIYLNDFDLLSENGLQSEKERITIKAYIIEHFKVFNPVYAVILEKLNNAIKDIQSYKDFNEWIKRNNIVLIND